MGMSLLSPLRPVHGNGEPLIELFGNALTFERITRKCVLYYLHGQVCPLNLLLLTYFFLWSKMRSR